MKLSHPMPDMAVRSLRRIEKTLAGVCLCGGESAALVKRLIEYEVGPAKFTVWLQCLTCGRSADGPLSLSEHYRWQDYSEWNPALREQWEADRVARFNASADNIRLDALKSRQQRRADYHRRCQTDPLWHALSSLVRRRADGHCEACLSAPAETVHHLTYAFGFLPPAWELRAVCHACHARLHADIHGTEDEWAPRTIVDRGDGTSNHNGSMCDADL